MRAEDGAELPPGRVCLEEAEAEAALREEAAEGREAAEETEEEANEAPEATVFRATSGARFDAPLVLVAGEAKEEGAAEVATRGREDALGRAASSGRECRVEANAAAGGEEESGIALVPAAAGGEARAEDERLLRLSADSDNPALAPATELLLAEDGAGGGGERLGCRRPDTLPPCRLRPLLLLPPLLLPPPTRELRTFEPCICCAGIWTTVSCTRELTAFVR